MMYRAGMTEEEFNHTVEDWVGHVCDPARVRDAARWMDQHPYVDPEHPPIDETAA